MTGMALLLVSGTELSTVMRLFYGKTGMKAEYRNMNFLVIVTRPDCKAFLAMTGTTVEPHIHSMCCFPSPK